MALAERIDSAADFRFGVEIAGIVVGWFTECGGLSIEREVHPYEEGGLNAYVHQLPGRVKASDITLKRGVADRELWRWFRQGLYNLQVERRNVSVILYGADHSERGRWDLIDAYPVQWGGPELKTDGNQVAVETLRIGQGGGGASTAVQRVTESGADGGESQSTAAAGQERAPEQGVNLPLLAEKVYDLLRQELRWERERLGRGRPW
jgi:phage tail-like protein